MKYPDFQAVLIRAGKIEHIRNRVLKPAQDEDRNSEQNSERAFVVPVDRNR